MTVQRRRRLLALLAASLLLTAVAYVWLWPEVRIAWADDPASQVRLGMTRAEVQALIGRPPDREHKDGGRPVTDVWNTGGEDFHVNYDADGRAFSFTREDNPVRKATRWVRRLFNR
jgi:hypothetical protein